MRKNSRCLQGPLLMWRSGKRIDVGTSARFPVAGLHAGVSTPARPFPWEKSGANEVNMRAL